MSGNDAVSSFKKARRDKILALCKEKVAAGISQNDLAGFLYSQGLDLNSAYEIFRELYGSRFWEAAEVFKEYSGWQEEIKATDDLTEDFLQGLRDDGY